MSMRKRAQSLIHELLSSYHREISASESRSQSWAKRLTDFAGLSPQGMAVLSLIVGLVSVALAGRIGVLASLIFLVVTSGVGVAITVVRRGKRRSSLDRDLPALLTALASSVRAGLDPMTSLLSAPQYLPPQTPLVEGIETLRGRLRSGWEEFAAIEGFLAEWQHADVELFKRCLILSRRHGSALAEPLHRVTRVIRQRQSFRRKTRAALAMHRLSAFGIALCGILIGMVQVSMNIDGVRTAVAHPIGWKLLSGGGALIVCGVGWMISLGREEAR